MADVIEIRDARFDRHIRRELDACAVLIDGEEMMTATHTHFLRHQSERGRTPHIRRRAGELLARVTGRFIAGHPGGSYPEDAA